MDKIKISFVPITKDIKKQISMEINDTISELNKSDNKENISMYNMAKNLINDLPDGYPVLISKK